MLGVTLGINSSELIDDKIGWLRNLLIQSSEALRSDFWQRDLVEIARNRLDSSYKSQVTDPRLRILFQNKLKPDDRQAAWERVTKHFTDREAPQIAINRAVFDLCAAQLTALPINGAGIDEVITILEGVTDSMSHWTYENKSRTGKSTPRKWDIDHEYHVQNLLWTLLRPIFSDLIDEESLPKVGHKTPRCDLGIPSLETIIEVKFMRREGLAEFRKITEEIAADRSLYLGNKTGYSKLIVFIWDDCRQTEEYRTLIDGLEEMEGIEKVIILPRPSRMDLKQSL